MKSWEKKLWIRVLFYFCIAFSPKAQGKDFVPTILESVFSKTKY